MLNLNPMKNRGFSFVTLNYQFSSKEVFLWLKFDQYNALTRTLYLPIVWKKISIVFLKEEFVLLVVLLKFLPPTTGSKKLLYYISMLI